jgi:protein-disulfide isomerase
MRGRTGRPCGRAKVTIVEFTDYECSYCARYHQETFRPLIAEYEDRVRYVIRHFPLVPIHPHAAKAAECAREQGRFWEYHDLLFDRQTALDEESLRRYAAELGLDESGFAACLLSGRNAEVVRADLEDGASTGWPARPPFS